MTMKKRLEIIQETLKEEKKVVVADLALKFDVTEETIRRDLDKLEQEGIAVRTYGGAVFNQDNPNVGVFYRKRALINPEHKRSIALKALPAIKNFYNLGFDSSTTTMELLRLLEEDVNKTVVTYSEAAIHESGKALFRIISTGGILNKKNLSYYGPIAIKSANHYRLDAFIMSCKGMTFEGSIFDTDEMEAEVKRNFIANANSVILLADHSKFGQTGFVNVCDFADIDMIVTNCKPSDEWLEKFSSHEVNIIY